MATTYNRLLIDVNEDINDIVTAKQSDTNSRYLDVGLYDNGTPIDLTDQSVKIYFKKPDSTEVYTEGEITDPTNGRCQFELTSQTLSVAGSLQAEISIWNGTTEILSTHTFTIHVLVLIRDDDAPPSTNEYGVLVTLFQNIQTTINTMNEVLTGFVGLQLSTDAAQAAAELAETAVGLVSDKIGTSTDTDTITMFGNQNTTRSDIASFRAYVEGMSNVKSVQRGTTASTTINISSVNPAKCHVTLYNSYLFYQTDDPSETAYCRGAIVISLTSTVLTITNNRMKSGAFSSDANDETVSWEVVEFY